MFSSAFTISSWKDGGYGAAILYREKVAMPQVFADGSEVRNSAKFISNSVHVDLKSATNVAKVFYSLDGSEPSLPYDESVSIDLTENTTVKTVSVIYGRNNEIVEKSEVNTVYFEKIDCIEKPLIESSAKKDVVFLDSLEVKSEVLITSDIIGAKIYYTTDGSTPSLYSDLYTEALPLLNTTVVKAIAVVDGFGESEVAARKFMVFASPNAICCNVEEMYVLAERGYLRKDMDQRIIMKEDLKVIYKHIPSDAKEDNQLYVCDNTYYDESFMPDGTVAPAGVSNGLVMLIHEQQGLPYDKGTVLPAGIVVKFDIVNGMPEGTLVNPDERISFYHLNGNRGYEPYGSGEGSFNHEGTVWPIVETFGEHSEKDKNRYYYIGVPNCRNYYVEDKVQDLHHVDDRTMDATLSDEFAYIKGNPANIPSAPGVNPVVEKAMEGVYGKVNGRPEVLLIKFHDTPTGIGVVEEDNGVSVVARKGFVDVVTPQESFVEIYNVSGALVMSEDVLEGKTTLPLEQGYYIVKVDDKSVKVFVR